MRRLACILSFCLLLLPAAPAGGAAIEHQVSVKDNFFDPAQVTIGRGETVEWTWVGSNHSVTRTSSIEPFDSGVDPSGGFSRQFENDGTFNYFCKVHSGMTGRVIVGTGIGGDPPPGGGGSQAGGGGTQTGGGGTQTGDTSGGAGTTDVIPPQITSASVSPSPFCGRRQGNCKRAGAKLRFRLSETAAVRVVVKKRFAKKASRTFTRQGKAGLNSLAFGTGLSPGRYTARLVATDAAKLASPSVTKSFSVRRPR